jgi:hypothetical protein
VAHRAFLQQAVNAIPQPCKSLFIPLQSLRQHRTCASDSALQRCDAQRLCLSALFERANPHFCVGGRQWGVRRASHADKGLNGGRYCFFTDYLIDSIETKREKISLSAVSSMQYPSSRPGVLRIDTALHSISRRVSAVTVAGVFVHAIPVSPTPTAHILLLLL